MWNAPTSCAWASRVLVNRAAARRHGAAVFGLPSRQAAFRRVPAPAPPRPGRASTSWWEQGHGPGRGGLQGRDGRDLTAAGAEAAGDALGRGGEVSRLPDLTPPPRSAGGRVPAAAASPGTLAAPAR